MPLITRSPLRRPRLAASAVAVASLLFAAQAAQARFINFDEHPWVLGPEEYAWYSNPVTDQYSALGVIFDEGYLQPAGSDDTYTSQYLLGGPYFSIRFTGTLPTFVSLAFSSPIPPLQAAVTAERVGGTVGTAVTGGDYWAGPDLQWVHTHYNGHSQASFHSPTGITSLWFGTESSTRITAKIDNLYFGNVPAVPEPMTLALWGAGLLTVGIARRRRHFLPPA